MIFLQVVGCMAYLAAIFGFVAFLEWAVKR